MSPGLTCALAEDMHVHSTFSDGSDTVARNEAAAEARGLHRQTCVDHVRRDTTWLPGFGSTVRAQQESTDVRRVPRGWSLPHSGPRTE
jgi:histidinol phosphatase-like PHP family hydrolase